MKIEDIEIEDRLSAISRLFIFSSNKRFKILRNEINLSDEIGHISSLINDEILKRIEINIFEENTIENILIYEQELNRLFINYNTELIDEDDLEDEIDLINSYTEIDSDFFSRNNLEINRDLKDKFKEIKISSSIIITYALKPNFLHLIEEVDFPNNFFATSIYKNKVILYHMSVNKDNETIIYSN